MVEGGTLSWHTSSLAYLAEQPLGDAHGLGGLLRLLVVPHRLVVRVEVELDLCHAIRDTSRHTLHSTRSIAWRQDKVEGELDLRHAIRHITRDTLYCIALQLQLQCHAAPCS